MFSEVRKAPDLKLKVKLYPLNLMKTHIRGTLEILATNVYIYIAHHNFLFIFLIFFPLIQLRPSWYTERQLLKVGNMLTALIQVIT